MNSNAYAISMSDCSDHRPLQSDTEIQSYQSRVVYPLQVLPSSSSGDQITFRGWQQQSVVPLQSWLFSPWLSFWPKWYFPATGGDFRDEEKVHCRWSSNRDRCKLCRVTACGPGGGQWPGSRDKIRCVAWRRVGVLLTSWERTNAIKRWNLFCVKWPISLFYNEAFTYVNVKNLYNKLLFLDIYCLTPCMWM